MFVDSTIVSDTETTKPIRLVVPPPDLERARVAAARNGMSMARMAQKAFLYAIALTLRDQPPLLDLPAVTPTGRSSKKK
jgi:hypothetical protein